MLCPPTTISIFAHAIITLFEKVKGVSKRSAAAFLLLPIALSASTAQAADSCEFIPTQYSVRAEADAGFEPLGDHLSLPPRLRPTRSEVRFTLPPVDRECVLLIDRVSLYALSVEVDQQPPVSFDFFRPGATDRFAAAGFTVMLDPHSEPRTVTLAITQLGVLSTQIQRTDIASLLALERRISAMHALSIIAPLMMAVLVGLFWLRLRDRALAAYVGMLAGLVLVTASIDGTLYFFPLGELFAGLRSMAHILLLSVFGLAVCVFFREFLAPLDRSGQRTFLALATAFTFTGVSSLLGIPIYNAIIQHLTTFSLIVATPLLIWQGIRSYRAGHPSAIYFLIGWTLPLGAIPLRLMAEYGVIDWNFWIRYAPRTGFLIEAMVFALGLTDRILRVRIERDRAEQARVRTERSLISYRQLAEADSLTGLASRRALETELGRWDAEAINGACLFIDLDRFKDFNDRFGHAQGDEALRSVATRLLELMPTDAQLARYGGEEIVALLPAMSLDSARELAERARALVETSVAGPDHCTVTVSIGAAERRAQEPMAQTLAGADAALYRAKSAGRNRVEIRA
ncbi:MAG: sensor domain-containing diguanylate cyclase [Pseudomarimonas sp.]